MGTFHYKISTSVLPYTGSYFDTKKREFKKNPKIAENSKKFYQGSIKESVKYFIFLLGKTTIYEDFHSNIITKNMILSVRY